MPTRFGGFEAIPDLGLPLKDFQEAVIAKQLEWIRAIATASAEDINEIIQLDEKKMKKRPLRWVMGRVEEATLDEEADERTHQTVEKLAVQCLSSLAGERADLDRVEGANAVMRAVLEAAAESLEQRGTGPRVFSGEQVTRFSLRLSILPLGQIACPFWLLQKDQMLACLIRSRERDREQGKPSYDLVISPLTEEDYKALEAKVAQRGARQMIVTRVVDLIAGPEGRLGGANLIVFQYEDWMLIQPRGILFGMNEVSESLRKAIKDRLAPGPFFAYQEKLTGEDHPCARRTAQWVETKSWHVSTGEKWTVDISPWAERVRKVADQIISNSFSDVEVISQRLLEFVVGDQGLASKIFERGFEPLFDQDHLIVKEMIELLDASARMPVENRAELETLRESIASLMGPLIELTDRGWDVVRPNIN